MASLFHKAKSERSVEKKIGYTRMTRLFVLLFVFALGAVRSPALCDCSDAKWESVRSAFSQRSGRAFGRLVGDGMMSLRLDGISQGRYTADQTTHLMQEFFDRTERCELSINDCGDRGNRSWAEGTLTYTLSASRSVVSEHILLEYCLDDDAGRFALCSIRSVTR